MIDSSSFKTGNKYPDSNGGKWRVIHQTHKNGKHAMIVCMRIHGLKMLYAIAISNKGADTATIILNKHASITMYYKE